MPTTITIEKPLGAVVVSSSIRWPPGGRMSEDEKTAVGAYTKEVEQTIRALSAAVRELQTKLDQKTVG